LAQLASVGRIVVQQGLARAPDYAPRLSTAQERLRGQLLATLETAGQEPPTVDELAASLNSDATHVAAIARLLAREGRLVAVEPARYYLAATLSELLDRLRAGMQPGADYGPAELREVLGFSRKFLIPFLEFTDRAGHTIRDASGRRRHAGT
jgi:selenocysteine-specific elongation factor